MLLDLIYPPRCQLCHRPGARLCRACAADLPRLPGPRCAQCAHPLTERRSGRCGRCQADPPAYAYTAAVFAYDHPLDLAIRQWKYQGRLAWTGILAEQWLQAWELLPERPQALLPVPLHWRRLASRGFNQAALLAQLWGRHLEIPVLHGAAQRMHHTPHQAGAQRATRVQAMEAVFTVRPLRPRHIALVDDVMTTGSTAQALAQAARRAGAERVDLWVLARTLQDEAIHVSRCAI